MKRTLLAILLSLSLSSTALAFAGPAPRRLHFKRGQTEIVVRGSLSSLKDRARYVLRVRAGQEIRVTKCGGTLSVSTDVSDSAGRGGDDHDMQGNSGFMNTEAGDYFISVFPSRKDSRRRGTFCLNVRVTDSDHARLSLPE